MGTTGDGGRTGPTRRSALQLVDFDFYGNECMDSKMVLWVFGYGSLIWNPGFEFDEKIIGFIKDYKRVFNLDHRVHQRILREPALWNLRKEPFIGALLIVSEEAWKRK